MWSAWLLEGVSRFVNIDSLVISYLKGHRCLLSNQRYNCFV